LYRCVVIAGTRPEIIKVAPIIRKILHSKLKLYFVLTGQHYDYSLSQQMIKDLELPEPNTSFELETSSPASQIAEIMTKLEKPLRANRDNIVIIQGDTNSVLSAALTAVKLRIPIAHVEAGLRSYDWRMPEEHNRRMVDHISNILFAPTKESEQNLLNEGVYGQIYVTGNTVIDAVNQHLPLAEKRRSEVLRKVNFSEYILITLHRSENVDNHKILGEIVLGLLKSKLPIIIPLHPRTKKRLIDFGFFNKLKSTKNIQIISPQGYLDFLVLMKHSKFIVTDSGGMQEEATSPSLSKRILVLRRSTERPEAIKAHITKLVKLESQEIATEICREWNARPKKFPSSPYGDGFASDKIIDIIKKSSKVMIAS
jgi:UDP-N-acetylglucosamine 2-epimerase (non-hydrolysing)